MRCVLLLRCCFAGLRGGVRIGFDTLWDKEQPGLPCMPRLKPNVCMDLEMRCFAFSLPPLSVGSGLFFLAMDRAADAVVYAPARTIVLGGGAACSDQWWLSAQCVCGEQSAALVRKSVRGNARDTGRCLRNAEERGGTNGGGGVV